MKAYKVWFRGNRQHTEMLVQAATKDQAREIFAAHHGVIVSGYVAVSTKI